MKSGTLKSGTIEQTEIESLAYRGEGIGHIKSKVIFVPFSAPGDLVEVRISEDKRNYLRGNLEHFKTRSPHRVVPLCDQFGECGGCHWQHLSYDYQLVAKEKILIETLARIGKVSPDTYECLPSIPSQDAFAYRCRVRLQCASRRRTVIGFFRAQSNTIVPIDRCELLPDFLNGIVTQLEHFLNSLEYFTPFTEVEILTSPEKEEALLAFTSPDPIGEDVRDFLKALKVDIPKVYGVSIENRQEDQTQIENFGSSGLPFSISFTPSDSQEPVSVQAEIPIQTFSQINLEQNLNMIRIVYDWTKPTKDKTILDLFCGTGNLSLPLARDSRRIIGLENNHIAVEYANSNAKLNGFENCEFLLKNVYSELEDTVGTGEVDVIIMDPPRRGAKESITKIAALKPSKIIYVSCNPTTLARDISLFSFANYRLNRVQLVDMFPQTYHIECIAELTPCP